MREAQNQKSSNLKSLRDAAKLVKTEVQDGESDCVIET